MAFSKNWKRTTRYANVEQVLKRRIADYLTRLGGVVVYYMRARPVPGAKVYRSHYMPNGVADIIACIRGRYVAVEVKRPGIRDWRRGENEWLGSV